MKIERTDGLPIVIGKRVTLGAVIHAIAAIFAHFDSDNAVVYMSIAIPITFVTQIVVANWIGITTRAEE